MSTQTKRTTRIIIVLISIVVLCFYGVKQYIAKSNTETVDKLASAITAQEESLVNLAELTRSNGSDLLTSRLITDCKALDRQRFDTLLDLLSKIISRTELVELNELFFKCGSFYADRKSMMAIKLSQQVDQLETLLTIEAVITAPAKNRATHRAIWKEIAEAELKTAEYFNSLVDLQGSIIKDLLSGKLTDSPELVATITEVNVVRGQMLILSKQIEVNKAKLQ